MFWFTRRRHPWRSPQPSAKGVGDDSRIFCLVFVGHRLGHVWRTACCVLFVQSVNDRQRIPDTFHQHSSSGDSCKWYANPSVRSEPRLRRNGPNPTSKFFAKTALTTRVVHRRRVSLDSYNPTNEQLTRNRQSALDGDVFNKILRN